MPLEKPAIEQNAVLADLQFVACSGDFLCCAVSNKLHRGVEGIPLSIPERACYEQSMLEDVRCHRAIIGAMLLALVVPLEADAAFLYHVNLLRGNVAASSSAPASSSSSSRPKRARPAAKSPSSSSRRIVRRSTSSSSSVGRIASIRRRRQFLPPVTPVADAELETVFLLVNEERTSRGLPALKRNQRLDIAAQLHAKDMADRDYFSHATPEGQLFDTRIRKAGYPDISTTTCNCQVFSQYGENIALGQPTAARVVEAWMLSPGHRENILEPAFEDVGYGRSGAYWVQDFGKATMLFAVPPKPKS